MNTHRIVISREFDMPVEKVFRAISDHENLGRLLRVPIKRIKDGVDDPNGVGSVRAVGVRALVTEETVVDFKRNELIGYKITRNSGPLSNHHGRIDFFERANRGSGVTWTVTFSAWPVVGAIIAFLIRVGLPLGLRNIR